jgi:hypothetical protein
MPYAYESVESVESVAAYEGAKQLPGDTIPETINEEPQPSGSLA